MHTHKEHLKAESDRHHAHRESDQQNAPPLRPGPQPVQGLTPAQGRLLETIRRFLSERGIPPTVQELADLHGVSGASIHGHLRQLEIKGVVRRTPRKARSLELLDPPAPSAQAVGKVCSQEEGGERAEEESPMRPPGEAKGGEQKSRSDTQGEGRGAPPHRAGSARSAHPAREKSVNAPALSVQQLVSIPILGTVTAGLPILAVENQIGELLVDSQIARGRCFALEVQGDSMIDAAIHHGDYVVVRQQPLAESGDIVVALLHDEATVKRLQIEEDTIALNPENIRYRPITVGPDDDLRILGKVIAVRQREESSHE